MKEQIVGFVRDPHLSFPVVGVTASLTESFIGVGGKVDAGFAAVGALATIWLAARVIVLRNPSWQKGNVENEVRHKRTAR